ncbi:MarR family transcriptional regulator [Galbitalea sp. SE-J8]|uniref:MarR family winged helix-turn-helix transcriptional regulator n=1 Tax=Galbitalea sp. SE-J8 TaxID=3054952 RepID=UPI00259CDB79|nr:MarR family transcriptional regulator [Galbitalea sp. SE-J8]MDM4762019.1 MarR family transcriptional regulator [Galbitalea sp. SE-J8]
MTDASDPTTTDAALVDALAQLTFTVWDTIADVAAAHALSPTQMRLLGILRDHEPTMSDLALHLGLDRSSVSGLIDRAVRRGLVRREPDANDRRSTRVALTPEGAADARAVDADAAAHIRPLLAGLGARDRSRLAGLLQRMLPVAPGAVGAPDAAGAVGGVGAVDDTPGAPAGAVRARGARGA